MNDLQAIKKLVQPACAQFGVRELSLFGSRARGNAKDDSDYDFVVLFERSQTGLLSDRFLGLLLFLEDQLERSVDLLELDAIHNPFCVKQSKKERHCSMPRAAQSCRAGFLPAISGYTGHWTSER